MIHNARTTLSDLEQYLATAADLRPGRVQRPPTTAEGADVRTPPVTGRPESVCPARGPSGLGLLEAAFAFLKTGVRAWATSPGVWNRLPGSLAIILATSAANSDETSGRTRLSGSASREMWAW